MIGRIADVFGSLGVDRIRLTGGEPLVRHDLPALVEILAGKPWLKDLALTTNGVLLAQHAAALRAAGLHRITVSLDTLRPERFQQLDFRVRQGNEHGSDAMLGLRDCSRYRGAQGLAIDPGGGRDVTHRDRHVIEPADHA